MKDFIRAVCDSCRNSNWQYGKLLLCVCKVLDTLIATDAMAAESAMDLTSVADPGDIVNAFTDKDVGDETAPSGMHPLMGLIYVFDWELARKTAEYL